MPGGAANFMSSDYGSVAVALLALTLAPRPPDGARGGAFESGAPIENMTWDQFRVRYALIAPVVVAFDVEMVYMFPWAVVFKRLGLAALLDMFVFMAILAVAIAFAWRACISLWARISCCSGWKVDLGPTMNMVLSVHP